MFDNLIMFLPSLSFLSILLLGSVEADSTMHQVIGAFADHHPVQCNILLFTYSNKFSEQRMLLDFYKGVIKNNYVPTVLENIDTRSENNAASFSAKRCNKPLRSFIMGNVSHVAKYMIEEKRKEYIQEDIWLLFVRDNSDQELIISQMELTIMSQVYVAQQTLHGYEFWELYRPSIYDRSRIVHYAKWNSETGLKATDLSIVQRRRDFGGAVLRAAVSKTRLDFKDSDRKHVKLLEAVWNLLEKELNFKTELIVVTDNGTNPKFPKNRQHILVEMLAKNEIDVSMEALLLHPSNLDRIDHSKTVAQTRYRIYVKKDGADYRSWSHLFHPFARDAWLLVISTIALFPVIILSIYSIVRKAGFHGKLNSLWDLGITSYQMICRQGGELQQELCSLSLSYLFFNLWAFLLHTMYAAVLASHLAVEDYTTQMYSLEELMENYKYKFGVRRNSPEFDIYYQVNKAAMEPNVSNLPSTYLEGLKRVCSEKYAFMASSVEVFELKSQLPCELDYLKGEAYTVNTVYAMSKHNAYLPFINQWLHKLREVGLLSKLNTDIFGLRPRTSENTQALKSLDFQDTLVLQILLTVGVGLSLLILFVELLYKMKRNRAEYPRKPKSIYEFFDNNIENITS